MDYLSQLSDTLAEVVEELTPRKPYSGQDLDLSKPDQIRLLTLLPGYHDAPLICTSHIVHLADKPSYMALSYVWGDPADRLPIQLNDQPNMPITRSLHAALEYLRSSDNPTTLWIDALCIDQSHSGEKAHQIPLMGAIYRNASTTCIWLGKESHNSDLAMQLIRQLDGNDLASPHNSPDSDGLQAIADLQKRPWWSRVWVIQEALLSPNPTVHCGGSAPSLPMEQFMVLDDIRRGWHRPSSRYLHHVQNAISQFSIALRNPFCGILTYWPDARIRLLSPTPESTPSTLSEWAQYLSDFQATDPRDKIYGLLGLGSDADREVMRYALERNLSASQVYTRAMCWFIRSERTLLQLSFDTDSRAACAVGEEGRTLPSWVMDFSNNIPSRSNDEGEGSWDEEGWFWPGYVPFIVEKTFNATGLEGVLGKRIEKDMFPFKQYPGLAVKGMVVDRIVYASGNRHIRAPGNTDGERRTKYSLERMRKTAEKVLEWEEEVAKPSWEDPYSSVAPWDGQTRRELFRRAVVANRDGAGLALRYGDEWDALFEVFLGRREMPAEVASSDEARLQYLLPVRLALIPRTAGRNFVITSKGYFGLAPLKSRVGDKVCVLEGGTVPFVLRPVEDSELTPHGVTPGERQRFFTLVGEAYVHGVSDGEWIRGQAEDKVIEVVIV